MICYYIEDMKAVAKCSSVSAQVYFFFDAKKGWIKDEWDIMKNYVNGDDSFFEPLGPAHGESGHTSVSTLINEIKEKEMKKIISSPGYSFDLEKYLADSGYKQDEDDDDETEDIEVRIQTALKKSNYEKAQRLLNPVIYDLEQQMDEAGEYYTYSEPMEQVLYLYYFSPHPDETFIPYSTAYYYYLLGSAYLGLNETEQARAMMVRAIQLDPVSSVFLLGLAEVCKQEDDFVKTFELSKKALTYAYTREDYARCIRNIGYCLIESEEYEDAAACFQYSQRWEKTEYAANALREIEKETGWSADESDLPGMSEIAGKYGFTPGLDPDIRELAEELKSECEDQDDEEQAAYFSSILEAMTTK